MKLAWGRTSAIKPKPELESAKQLSIAVHSVTDLAKILSGRQETD
jgi:hypothetical protein